MIKIELAKTTDLDGVMRIIKACAADLISKKIFQWSEKYPSREVFKNDIKEKPYILLDITQRLLVV